MSLGDGFRDSKGSSAWQRREDGRADLVTLRAPRGPGKATYPHGSRATDSYHRNQCPGQALASPFHDVRCVKQDTFRGPGLVAPGPTR